MSSLLARYIEDITKDLEINDMNVAKVAKSLPAKRHFWGAKLINHKIELQRDKKKREQGYKEVEDRIKDGAPVQLTMKTVRDAADSTEAMRSLNDSIRENENIIEFLESVQKNFFTATYDLKNIIELIKLEQQ